MITECRIIATMTFQGATAEADRDEWYTAIKNQVIAAKPSKPAYLAAHMTKDEYIIPEKSTEPI